MSEPEAADDDRVIEKLFNEWNKMFLGRQRELDEQENTE